jgi:RecB family exonuclease
MDTWRENFVGVQALHKKTNLLVFGAVDDIWVSPSGELMVVDYKATSKEGVVDKLDDTRWHNQYRRQMEVYQWLLRQNGFVVSATGYFVYVNGQKDKSAFDGKLEFDVHLIPYVGSDAWVEPTLLNMKACLLGALPNSGELCEFCPYRNQAADIEIVKQGLVAPLPKPAKPKKTSANQSESLF